MNSASFDLSITALVLILDISRLTRLQYVVLGPRKSPMPLVRVFSENDKIFCQEKKYVD